MSLYEPMLAPTPDDVLDDPSASDWIKHAVQDLLDRDPVDALNDVAALHHVMQRRFAETLERTTENDAPGDR